MARNAAPLVLGSQLTITRGQHLRFSASDLTPRTLEFYEIRAIRMLAYPTIETGSPTGGASTSLKGFLRWQFTLGMIPLTDSFIPMWNLSPTRQSIVELGGYFEWRFRKPMLVAPGARLDAQVQLNANTPNVGASPTITVALAYAGVMRGDLDGTPPRMTDVPFASCWDTSATGYQGLGSPADVLRNPLYRPVDVEMLVGRVQNDSTGAEGDDGQTLQIFDPTGHALHRNGTVSIDTFFTLPTRRLDYEGRINPGQHFAVRLDAAPSATYRPMISYLGSRREEVQT